MATLHEYARSMSTVRHVLAKDPTAADRVHVVTSFGDADFVLRSKEFTVLTAEDGFSRDVSDPILGDTLSRVDGPAHFERRRIEAALFRPPTIRANEASVLRPALERVLAELRDSQGPGALRADLHHISEQVLGEIVAALIGLDGLDSPEGRAKFDTYYQDIDNGVRITWATGNIERLAAMAAAALDRLVEDSISSGGRCPYRRAEQLAQGLIRTLSHSHLSIAR